jgi:uncharacterized protein
MQLNEVNFDGAVPVDSYGPGFFRIGGEVINGPMIAVEAQARAWGGLADEAALIALADQADVIFIGMGAEIAHLPKPLREALEETGVGVEVMSSPSACRTYNVLLSEGRRVALAVLPL